MCGNETGSGRESEEQAHTSLPVIHSPLLPDPAAHVPTRVGVAGGGKKTARQAPTPKYKQLSLNQNCLSRPSPALAREGHMASDLRLATRGGGGPSHRPGRGVSPRTGKAGVSTSKQLGDIGENGWDQGLEGTWKQREVMREGGSVRRWEAPGSGAGAEGRLLPPPVHGVMRGNRAWRRREAAWAAGRGVWRSLDKEMMKRERYIYQGGGDRWEGVKRTNCSTTTTGNTALLTHPKGRADPSAGLAPRQNHRRGAPAPDRTRVPGWGWIGL